MPVSGKIQFKGVNSLAALLDTLEISLAFSQLHLSQSYLRDRFKRTIFLIPITRLDKRPEERVWFEGFGFEFGVELAAEDEGVAGDFYYFYISRVGGGSGDS